MNACTLDLVDQHIVELLQCDGRMSNAEIGRRVGVTEATVRRRIERLTREDVVTIAAFLNPMRLGYSGVAIIGLRVDLARTDEIVAALTARDEIRYIASAIGRYDLILEVALADPGRLRTFLTEIVGVVPGIREIETSLTPAIQKFSDRWWRPEGWEQPANGALPVGNGRCSHGG